MEKTEENTGNQRSRHGSDGVSAAVDHQTLLWSLVMTSFGVTGYKRYVLSNMIHDLTAWSHGYSPSNYHPIIHQGNYSSTEQKVRTDVKTPVGNKQRWTLVWIRPQT